MRARTAPCRKEAAPGPRAQVLPSFCRSWGRASYPGVSVHACPVHSVLIRKTDTVKTQLCSPHKEL